MNSIQFRLLNMRIQKKALIYSKRKKFPVKRFTPSKDVLTFIRDNDEQYIALTRAQIERLSKSSKVNPMKKLFASLLVAVSAFFSQAYAAVPADVTTALTDAKADGVNVAGIVLGVIIAIAAFKYIRKAL